MPKRKRRRKPSSKSELVPRDGALSITFVNTGTGKRKALETYADLLVWGQTAGVLSDADRERLERTARERTADADAVARRARELHARLKRIFLALSFHETPDADDIDALNEDLGAALAARRLLPAESGYRWSWGERGGDDLDRMLWPVLLSAADVLSTKYHRKVRQCAGEDCELLFVDRAPGSPRKWCDSAACGHRARSHKHYHTKVKQYRKKIDAMVEARAKERRRLAEKTKPPHDRNPSEPDV